MLLAASLILGANRGTLSAPTALRLHLIPNLVLVACCTGWLAAGRVILKPNQVVLQGWAKVIDETGRARRAYVQRHVPRSQWHTLDVSGLLLATLTWTDQGETIVLRHLGQPYLLRHLLAPQREWSCTNLTQRLYTHRARGLGLLRAFALLRLLLHVGIVLVRRISPETAPGLEQAAQRSLHRARHLFCTLRELPDRRSRHIDRSPRRLSYVQDLVQPGDERAWFARLLQEVETSALAWRPAAHTQALLRRTR
jgi:hypothetical protein